MGGTTGTYSLRCPAYIGGGLEPRTGYQPPSGLPHSAKASGAVGGSFPRPPPQRNGEMLRITAKVLEEMFDHCKEEREKTGNEACGYLAGKNGLITRAFQIPNDAQSPTFYEMNSGGQLKCQKEIRLEGLEHLANYHSHVATQAYPSKRDIDNATQTQEYFDGYYVVVTLENSMPQAKAFIIRDGSVLQEEDLIPE